MKKKIIIFGCGGHAKIIVDCIETTKIFKPLGFIDDKNYDIPFSKKTDLFYRIRRLIDEKQMGILFKVMLIKNNKNKFKTGFQID